jgi:hypothetical protein
VTNESEKRPEVPFEGILYAEVSGWITIVGMIVAVVGLSIGFVYGGGVIDEMHFMKDLIAGLGERSVWTRDSVFSGMPEHYWFFKERMDGDELSMIGLIVAAYGGVVGIWGMLISMFRKKEVLLYKRGLYTILVGVIALIMSLAATGLIALR